MKKHPLATVVNFCSNESRFIKPCLEQCVQFSKQVIVPVCDHFFDGTKEDLALLENIYKAFPQVLFVQYPFIPEKVPSNILKKTDPAHFWHSLSRLIAAEQIEESIDHVLFLDADEIPDAKRFSCWLDCSDYSAHTVLKLANYWYFREPVYQAEKWEDSVVFAQKRALEPHLLLKKEERDAIYGSLPGPKRRMVLGVDGQPMFHHYSWVRTQEQMLKKVSSWGHCNDRSWKTLVEEEFKGPFQGKDFIHNYSFKTVPARFEIPEDKGVFSSNGNPNVIRLTEKNVLSAIKKASPSIWGLLFSLFP